MMASVNALFGLGLHTLKKLEIKKIRHSIVVSVLFGSGKVTVMFKHDQSPSKSVAEEVYTR